MEDDEFFAKESDKTDTTLMVDPETYVYDNMIPDIIIPLKNALSPCNPCACVCFDVEQTENSFDEYQDDSSESSSHASDVDLGSPFNNIKLVVAALKSDLRLSSVHHEMDLFGCEEILIKHSHDYYDKSEFQNTKTLNETRQEIKKPNKIINQPPDEPCFKFTLPTDFGMLENMTAMEYLENYLELTESHIYYYTKTLRSIKHIREPPYTTHHLYLILNKVLVNTLTLKQFQTILYLTDTHKTQPLTIEQIFAMIALGERLFRDINICVDSSKTTNSKPGRHELLDLSTLLNTIHNYPIQKKLHQLLAVLFLYRILNVK